MSVKGKNKILLLIVFAQFFCTSLWFAGNAVVDDLIIELGFPNTAIGHLTSAIQFGFISGTMIYAFFNIADRFSPSKVFFVSAIIGALANLIFLLPNLSFSIGLASRFLTGFFLAGIYPVGMKIAADYFDRSLGKSLGFLVGALVIGTAFPHFVNAFLGDFSFRYVILAMSLLAVIGGILILLFVPDGPFRKKALKLEFSKAFSAFKYAPFRSAAFGYFGHMWELYTLYAFIPIIIQHFNNETTAHINVSIWSFIIIGSGGIACFISGIMSRRFGLKEVASFALLISGIICLSTPILMNTSSQYVFLVILVIWGMTVVADSPLFSTLVANNAEIAFKGTALTIVNSIGFALTIVSIQLISYLLEIISINWVFVLLAIGPLFGLLSLWFIKGKSSDILKSTA